MQTLLPLMVNILLLMPGVLESIVPVSVITINDLAYNIVLAQDIGHFGSKHYPASALLLIMGTHITACGFPLAIGPALPYARKGVAVYLVL
jgi:hypothetical protein